MDVPQAHEESSPLPSQPPSSPGAVTTFHSHKGGVGRTMALANIGVLLASREHASAPVLMVDWDLETPGLQHYFPQEETHAGVLEFFLACRDQLQRRSRRAIASGGDALAREVLATVGWERYVVRVDQCRPLYLMPAGRLDAGYTARLSSLRWEALFHACPALFRNFAAMLARHYRHVLVDARSGRGDSTGICTTLLPDRLVLPFETNRQSLDGLQALVQRATTYRRSHDEEQRPLLVYPLPVRMALDDAGQRAAWRRGDAANGARGYQPVFERVLGEAYGIEGLSLESYFNEVQLPQSRALAQGERVVAGNEAEVDRYSATRAYEALLAWLGPGHLPWQSRSELPLLAEVAQARAGQDGGAARMLALAHGLFRLGLVCRESGREAAAPQYFRESASLYAQAAGEEHLDTVAARAHLAAMQLKAGWFDEARLLLRGVVEVRSRVLGPEHADVLDACIAQAQALAGQGHLAAALARLQEVLDVQQRVLGREHPLTLHTLALQAALLAQAGDLEQARLLQELVLAARTRLLGAGHPATVRTGDALVRTIARLDAEAHAGDRQAPALQQFQQPYPAMQPDPATQAAAHVDPVAVLGDAPA